MNRSLNSDLLRIEDLTVDFDAAKPTKHRALEGVSLSIREGEVVGLVGESGSGKSVLAQTILGILPRNGRVQAGQVVWRGRDLLALGESEFRKVRGGQIAMIFQDPQASLNPVYRVGRQIEWVLKLHRGITGVEAKTEVLRILESVKLRDPERCYRCYPHELSGGMCQRAMIAMALACRPKLLIADEPTSALDVTVQAELVQLLREIREEFQMAMLFVTHDLGVASHLCQQVVVLHRGKMIEHGPIREVFSEPKQDYTRRLIGSIMSPLHPPSSALRESSIVT